MSQLDALIARWQQGDQRAAELIYDQHREHTFRLAYGLLGHREDAEEVTQDALTYALLNIGRYDADRASFTTWLHTITVSRCRDKRRRKWLPGFSLTAWLQKGRDLPDDRPRPDQVAAAGEMRSDVWQAVQQLKRPYREAIILRYWAGHTYREMADILGCPLPTAQSRVRLAYDKLRATLLAKEVDLFLKERL